MPEALSLLYAHPWYELPALQVMADLNGFVIDQGRGVPPHLLHDSYGLVDFVDHPYDPDIQAGYRHGRLYEVMRKLGRLRWQARELPSALRTQPPTFTAAVWQSVEEGRTSEHSLQVGRGHGRAVRV